MDSNSEENQSPFPYRNPTGEDLAALATEPEEQVNEQQAYPMPNEENSEENKLEAPESNNSKEKKPNEEEEENIIFKEEEIELENTKLRVEETFSENFFSAYDLTYDQKSIFCLAYWKSSNYFLQEDRSLKEEVNELIIQVKNLSPQVTYLGFCESLDMVVFEVHNQSLITLREMISLEVSLGTIQIDFLKLLFELVENLRKLQLNRYDLFIDHILVDFDKTENKVNQVYLNILDPPDWCVILPNHYCTMPPECDIREARESIIKPNAKGTEMSKKINNTDPELIWQIGIIIDFVLRKEEFLKARDRKTWLNRLPHALEHHKPIRSEVDEEIWEELDEIITECLRYGVERRINFNNLTELLEPILGVNVCVKYDTKNESYEFFIEEKEEILTFSTLNRFNETFCWGDLRMQNNSRTQQMLCYNLESSESNEVEFVRERNYQNQVFERLKEQEKNEKVFLTPYNRIPENGIGEQAVVYLFKAEVTGSIECLTLAQYAKRDLELSDKLNLAIQIAELINILIIEKDKFQIQEEFNISAENIIVFIKRDNNVELRLASLFAFTADHQATPLQSILPPEVYEMQKANIPAESIDFAKSLTWELGLLIDFIFTKKWFYGEHNEFNIDENIELIDENHYNFSSQLILPKELENKLKILLQNCVVGDIRKRIGVQDVKNKLEEIRKTSVLELKEHEISTLVEEMENENQSVELEKQSPEKKIEEMRSALLANYVNPLDSQHYNALLPFFTVRQEENDLEKERLEHQINELQLEIKDLNEEISQIELNKIENNEDELSALYVELEAANEKQYDFEKQNEELREQHNIQLQEIIEKKDIEINEINEYWETNIENHIETNVKPDFDREMNELKKENQDLKRQVISLLEGTRRADGLLELITNNQHEIVLSSRPLGESGEQALIKEVEYDHENYVSKEFKSLEDFERELKAFIKIQEYNSSNILRLMGIHLKVESSFNWDNFKQPNITYALLLDKADLNLQEYAKKYIWSGESQNFANFEWPMPTGEEFDFLQNIKFMLDIAQGLREIHSAGISHQDLKPENVLIKNKRCLLTDFGIAKFSANESRETELHGYTFEYVAPEQLEGVATIKSDVWAFGCILFYIFTGMSPWFFERGELLRGGEGTLEQRLTNIMLCSEGFLDNISDRNVEEYLYDRLNYGRVLELVKSCLKREYEARPTMEKIIQDLNEILSSLLQEELIRNEQAGNK